MNWDSFGDDATRDTAGDQLCPEGRHTAIIVWCGIQTKEWAKGANNEGGHVVVVKLDVKPGIKPVWESIPCHQRGKVEALCRAAGVEPPRGEWDEQVLKDRAVSFESVLAISKAGNDFVKIEKFFPGPEPLPAAMRAPANRTPKQKADAVAAAGTNDDIPF